MLGDDAADVLFRASWWLPSGEVLGWDFNRANTAFIPKKPDANDGAEVVRKPAETRSIGLKDTDNKIIGAVVNRCLRRHAAKHLSEVQRGFVAGRNLLDNVVDIDAEARLLATDSRCCAPVLAAFDYGTAFPSLSQLWLFLTIAASQLPSGFADLISGFFNNVSAVASSPDGVFQLRFSIASGVIQGCALSGLLFSLAIDPFLRYIKRVIVNPGLGYAHACADDIAVCLSHIRHLSAVHAMFAKAERFATLRLKPPKCTVVPLFRYLPLSFDTATVEFKKSRGQRWCFTETAEQVDVEKWVSLWLRRYILSWQAFAIKQTVL